MVTFGYSTSWKLEVGVPHVSDYRALVTYVQNLSPTYLNLSTLLFSNMYLYDFVGEETIFTTVPFASGDQILTI